MKTIIEYESEKEGMMVHGLIKDILMSSKPKGKVTIYRED